MFDLNIIPRSREGMLLEKLAARYFFWADGLPPPLQNLARLRSTYTGHPGAEAFAGPASINPLIACAPWLFWDTISGLPDQTFLDIAEAGMYLTLASGVIDHLVDGQYPEPGPMALFHKALSERGAACYRQAFSSGSPFWPEYDRLTELYTACLSAELATQQSLDRIPYKHFEWFAGGKASPMSLTLAGLCTASDQLDLLPPIEASIHKSYVAGQLLDDTLDWVKDYEAEHVTYMLALIPAEPAAEGEPWPSLEQLQASNRLRWVDQDVFAQAVAEFDRAIAAVEGIACPAWVAYLEEYRAITRKYQRETMTGHLKDVFTRAYPIGSPDPEEKTVLARKN